jgi:6-phosphogluconolactonase
MGYERIQAADDAALALVAADRWLDRVEAAVKAGLPHRVALAGGRITKRFLATVATRSKERGISLAGVDFFWGDERCVPPGDPESNHRLAQEALLVPAEIASSRIHRVLGELDPASAAALAEQELRRVTGVEGAAMPVLDLVFLGMGEDAHVASLFPGAIASVTESACVYVGTTGPKPPPRRVTLTYRALAAAREVWVLASGAGKEAALRASLESGSQTPLGRVLREREKTVILTDIGG